MLSSFLGMAACCLRAVALFAPFACAFVLALAAPAPARATIRYEISLARPAQHQFHVTMTIPGVTDIVTVQMPAWNALYQIRDFAYRVSDFRAFDDAGIAMTVRRLDKQTWRIEGPNRPLAGRSLIRIEYASYWDDPGPFGTQLNDEHAFLNLAMVLCYVPERRGGRESANSKARAACRIVRRNCRWRAPA